MPRRGRGVGKDLSPTFVNAIRHCYFAACAQTTGRCYKCL